MTLKSNKIKIGLGLYLLLCINLINPAHSRSVEKQTIMAALTLNIARFTSWPKLDNKENASPLNLCLYGDNMIEESFTKLENKTVNNRKLQLTKLSRLRNIQQCQILYISGLQRNRLISLLAELKNQPILTIGEEIDFIKAGGIISLQSVQGKIQLNINLTRLKQADLVISSRLLKLAKIYNFPPPTEESAK